MSPRIPITSPKFVYRDSASTDIRITFAAERKRLETIAKKIHTVTAIKSRRA